MPKFTYVCNKCNKEIQKITKIKHVENCSCGSVMERQLPELNGAPLVNELVDPMFGVKQKADQEQNVKERSDKYYWTIEVPKMVRSGVYSIETMLENGWIYFNDKKEMCINDKPPSKR